MKGAAGTSSIQNFGCFRTPCKSGAGTRKKNTKPKQKVNLRKNSWRLKIPRALDAKEKPERVHLQRSVAKRNKEKRKACADLHFDQRLLTVKLFQPP